FTLNLSNPSLGTLTRAQATATINTVLPFPTISVSNSTVTNVASGTTTANFTLSLSEPLSDGASVAYATADGTATAGSDYRAVKAPGPPPRAPASAAPQRPLARPPLFRRPGALHPHPAPGRRGGGGGGGGGRGRVALRHRDGNDPQRRAAAGGVGQRRRGAD